jgi:hypothetical protein
MHASFDNCLDNDKANPSCFCVLVLATINKSRKRSFKKGMMVFTLSVQRKSERRSFDDSVNRLVNPLKVTHTHLLGSSFGLKLLKMRSCSAAVGMTLTDIFSTMQLSLSTQNHCLIPHKSCRKHGGHTLAHRSLQKAHKAISHKTGVEWSLGARSACTFFFIVWIAGDVQHWKLLLAVCWPPPPHSDDLKCCAHPLICLTCSEGLSTWHHESSTLQ